MSWMTYYVEVSSRQHEDALRRRLTRPRPTLERIPKQRSDSRRRMWGRPWSRLLARRTGRTARRQPRVGRTAADIRPAGR